MCFTSPTRLPLLEDKQKKDLTLSYLEETKRRLKRPKHRPTQSIYFLLTACSLWFQGWQGACTFIVNHFWLYMRSISKVLLTLFSVPTGSKKKGEKSDQGAGLFTFKFHKKEKSRKVWTFSKMKLKKPRYSCSFCSQKQCIWESQWWHGDH